jgi:peroxin-11C
LFLRLTTLIDNFFGQAYYPVEHIAWARDQKLISGQSNNLWTLGILLWLGSLCVSVAQSLWLLRKLQKEEEIWRKQRRKSHQEGQKSG